MITNTINKEGAAHLLGGILCCGASLALSWRPGSSGRSDQAAQDQLGIQGKGLIKHWALGLNIVLILWVGTCALKETCHACECFLLIQEKIQTKSPASLCC